MTHKPTFKTCYPMDRPDFNTWCKMFNVSKEYADKTGIQNAQRIMQLWNGYDKMKDIFKNLKSGNDNH